MNPTYKLKDIIHFWQRQMQNGFPVIEAIVNLVEYKRIQDVNKSDVIVKLLRNHGLFEIGYTGDVTFSQKIKDYESIVEQFESKEVSWGYRSNDFAVEIININILNARIELCIVLN
jgi:hypothetical protein